MIASDALSLKRNPKIEEAPLQGELMLFDPASSKFFVMNPTMAFLWRQCDGRTSLRTMVERLPTAFSGVDRVSAEAELRSALNELIDLGLVVPEGGQ